MWLRCAFIYFSSSSFFSVSMLGHPNEMFHAIGQPRCRWVAIDNNFIIEFCFSFFLSLLRFFSVVRLKSNKLKTSCDKRKWMNKNKTKWKICPSSMCVCRTFFFIFFSLFACATNLLKSDKVFHYIDGRSFSFHSNGKHFSYLFALCERNSLLFSMQKTSLQLNEHIKNSISIYRYIRVSHRFLDKLNIIIWAPYFHWRFEDHISLQNFERSPDQGSRIFEVDIEASIKSP